MSDFLLIEPYTALGFGVEHRHSGPLLARSLYRVTGYHTGDFLGECLGFFGDEGILAMFQVRAVETGELEIGQTVEINRLFASFQYAQKLVKEEALDA